MIKVQIRDERKEKTDKVTLSFLKLDPVYDQNMLSDHTSWTGDGRCAILSIVLPQVSFLYFDSFVLGCSFGLQIQVFTPSESPQIPSLSVISVIQHRTNLPTSSLYLKNRTEFHSSVK